MPSSLLPLLLLLLLLLSAATAQPQLNGPLIFHGFSGSNLVLSGKAKITSDGLLQLTDTSLETLGHGFFPSPFRFKSGNCSFSSLFVFGIIPKYEDSSGHGIAFALAPSSDLQGTQPSQFLGIFSNSDVGNASNHIAAVEFDTIQNHEYEDMDGNHVGIDINGLRSKVNRTASYTDENSQQHHITLAGAQPIQASIEYDCLKKRMEVTIWPAAMSRPRIPLLSSSVDLAAVLAEETYVGFSASNGGATANHYILGWSFSLNGPAPPLDLRQLPRLPVPRKKIPLVLASLVTLSAVLLAAVLITGFLLVRRWRRKFADVMEDWEREYGPHRFSFRDLYRATRGFKEDHVIGFGGFGKVYRGVIPTSKAQVAVKRVSDGSQQGMPEFVAEIVSMGRLRHRNLVQLLGYCRRRGELLLIYEYMPNGSLDKHLYTPGGTTLSWKQRLRIIKGVAAGLFYLHEGWEQTVVHRDIKAGNVLLDGDFNGRLGDFGLARLHDHGSNLQTTRVVGTIGYLAPEMTRTGKATTSTDVYAFGAFLLEVACGRRPIEMIAAEESMLVDSVLECWKRGAILKAADPKLAGDFAVEEMEMVLQLGLQCLHPDPAARPDMRQVVMFLDGEAQVPPPDGMHSSSMAMRYAEGFDEFAMSYPTTAAFTTSRQESPLVRGR